MSQYEYAQQGERRWLLRITTVLIAVAAAAALRWILARVPVQADPFIEFYPAIILVALYDGVVPGMLTVALSTVAAVLLLHLPMRLGMPQLVDWARAGPFMATEVLIAWICGRAHGDRRARAS